MYLDSHCHLNEERFENQVDEIYKNAINAGVFPMVVIGWDLESSKKAVAIAEKYEHVYSAVGFHPENLENVSDEALLEIEKLARSSKKVIAIGEIGLDHHWFKDPKDHANQIIWFIKQIELANKLDLPISIHGREASGDILKVLKEHKVNRSGVLHCYSGSVETLKELSTLGFYFGFDGPITYKNAKEPKACVQACPIDRILSETDCPYLPPVPLRGTTNVPANIPYIVKMMAELKEIPVEHMVEHIKENFERLFLVKL